MKIQIPKGTRDFYPEDMRVQNHIFEIWKEVCLVFGYEEYESPTFEHLELYTQKSGDEIVSQLYHFEDKGKRQLALRPEMTPTLARMINQRGPSLKLPVKWFSIPRLYRYERAQKGRLREFFQLNMDIVGTNSLWAEVDLISAIIEMLKKFGLTEKDFCVRVSSRKLLAAYLSSRGLEEIATQKVYAALDKWGKVPEAAFVEMLPEELDRPQEMIHAFLKSDSKEALANFKNMESTKGVVEELQTIFESLEKMEYGSYVEFDPAIVRGLAYYTGTVFEVFDRGREFRAIAGGGRYDNLLEHMGGHSISGVGFGIGDVVLYELLKKKNSLPQKSGQLDYYIVYFTEPSVELADLARKLRNKGRRVAYGFESSKLKKQMSLAEESGATHVLFFGSDKAPQGFFEVKELKTREQSLRKFEEL